MFVKLKRSATISLLVVVLLIGSSGNQLYTAFGHVAGRTLQAWTPTPPTINGEVVASEWQNAASSSFSLSIGGNPYTGTFYVMNDATNLYVAIKIADDDLNAVAPDDVFFIYFDSDNDGTYESGEDAIAQYAGATGFLDRFLEVGISVEPDTVAGGGTNDGLGASARHGSDNHFELSHPLNSADDARDFSLNSMNTVGFTIGYRDAGLGYGYWPADMTLDTTGWGDVVIAVTPPTLSAWTEVAPTINGLIDACLLYTSDAADE